MKFSSKGKSEVEDGSEIEHRLTHTKLKLKNTNKQNFNIPVSSKKRKNVKY